MKDITTELRIIGSKNAEIASLISDKMEILEALEAMVEVNGGVAVMPTVEARKQNAALEMAKAAIAKAKGEAK